MAHCRLLESPEKDSNKTAQQVVDTADASQSVHLSNEHKGSLKQSVYSMLADASPSTPPAGKPSLSPPPPDTPCESSAAGSVSSDKADHTDTASPGTTLHPSAKSSTNGSSLHAAARAFVPNVNAPAFVPNTAPKISAINAHTANGTDGNPNGYGVNGYHNLSPHSGSSPHAVWEEAAYSEAAGYQNGWSGAYDGYNGGYNNGYAGYGYGGMTPDGLFIPQQVHSLFLTVILLFGCLLSACHFFKLFMGFGMLLSTTAEYLQTC